MSLFLCLSLSPGVGRCRGPQCNQREGLHPGHGALPGPEGAPRPHRQGDGSLLGGGPLRPQRSWEKWRQDRHLEGGVEMPEKRSLIRKEVVEETGNIKGMVRVGISTAERGDHTLCYTHDTWRNHLRVVWSDMFTQSITNWTTFPAGYVRNTNKNWLFNMKEEQKTEKVSSAGYSLKSKVL